MNFCTRVFKVAEQQLMPFLCFQAAFLNSKLAFRMSKQVARVLRKDYAGSRWWADKGPVQHIDNSVATVRISQLL